MDLKISSNNEEIFSKIKKIVGEVLNIEEEKIRRESRLIDDLGAESLDVITLLMEFEDEFKQTIPDEDALKMSTIADIENYILQKKQMISVKV